MTFLYLTELWSHVMRQPPHPGSVDVKLRDDDDSAAPGHGGDGDIQTRVQSGWRSDLVKPESKILRASPASEPRTLESAPRASVKTIEDVYSLMIDITTLFFVLINAATPHDRAKRSVSTTVDRSKRLQFGFGSRPKLSMIRECFVTKSRRVRRSIQENSFVVYVVNAKFCIYFLWLRRLRCDPVR